MTNSKVRRRQGPGQGRSKMCEFIRVVICKHITVLLVYARCCQVLSVASHSATDAAIEFMQPVFEAEAKTEGRRAFITVSTEKDYVWRREGTERSLCACPHILYSLGESISHTKFSMNIDVTYQMPFGKFLCGNLETKLGYDIWYLVVCYHQSLPTCRSMTQCGFPTTFRMEVYTTTDLKSKWCLPFTGQRWHNRCSMHHSLSLLIQNMMVMYVTLNFYTNFNHSTEPSTNVLTNSPRVIAYVEKRILFHCSFDGHFLQESLNRFPPSPMQLHRTVWKVCFLYTRQLHFCNLRTRVTNN